MPLVGKIQDISPAEILVYLSDSLKTGKLSFTTGTEEGMIVFRDGKIVYAASSSVRETFGSIALGLGIINRDQLEKALRLQHRSNEEKRLGEILVSFGAMTEHDIQRILVHQVGQVIREIFEWDHGFFRFRNLEIETFSDFEVDAADFVVGSPIDTRSMALDAAREQDESSREAALDDDVEEPSEHMTLGQIMAEVAGPALTAETIREILSAASATLARGVLFAVRKQSAQGLAHFGLVETIAPPSERVRQLVIPMDENSLISTVVRDRTVFRGAPDHVRGNTSLMLALGDDWPTDCVVLPVMIGDRVAMVLYADNQPSGKAVGSTEALEAALTIIGQRLAEANR